MTYETYIFKPNPEKKRDDLLYLLYLGIAGIVVFVFYLMNILGIGLFAGAGITYKLFKIKLEDDKKKGVKRFGHLTDKLTISTNSITFRIQLVPDQDLKNVLIYADDYQGKSNEFIGASYGIDNRIEFEFKGNAYSFQFQVLKKEDLKLISDIALIIEKKTNTKNYL